MGGEAQLLWRVDSLRCTLFPEPAVPAADQDRWWLAVMDQEPDGLESKPKQGHSKWEGAVDQGRFSLTVEPGRIDWTLSALGPGAVGEPAALPQYVDVIGEFRRRIRTWLKLPNTPAAARLAFGAALMEPVDTRQAGYQRLQSYLLATLKVDPDNSSDLLYQINRPRGSGNGPDGLRINRLSTWSVGYMTRIQLVPGPSAFQQSAGHQASFCRLELDINTDPRSGGAIGQCALGAVFEELVDLGEEIAAKGDIP